MFSKHAFLGPIILIALFAVGYPSFWLYSAAFGTSMVEDWIEKQRLNGFTITHGALVTSGFPFTVQITLATPEATNAATGISWQSSKLQLSLQPWNLRRFRIEAFGPQQIRYSDRTRAAGYTANASDIEAVAAIDEFGSLAAISVILNDIHLKGVGQGPLLQASQILADLKYPDSPPTVHNESALEVSLAANSIKTTALQTVVLGDTINNIRIKAEFLGPLSGHSVPNALSTWRRHGGTLEVHWLNMVWGALDLRANGTVALDPRMRPLGALTADIRGYEETLEALAEANLLSRDILPASRVALNLLAKTVKTETRPVLTVPITAQEGALYLGPIKLAELPVLFNVIQGRPSAQQD